MNDTRRVGNGNTIVMHYKLSSQTGEDFESTFDETPIRVTLGQGDLAVHLEQCLLGLATGERHVFLLEPEQAFGRSDERLIQRIPVADFPADVPPKPQAMIEFQLPNGTTMPGVIKEVGPSEVVVDFNHPLSDCAVAFEVEVLEISN